MNRPCLISLDRFRTGQDGRDSRNALTRLNGSVQDSVDMPNRSLKVATRVQIPLGLLSKRRSESSAS